MNNIQSTVKFLLVITSILVIGSILGSATNSFSSIFVLVSLFFVVGNIVSSAITNEETEIEIIALATKYHSENN